MCGIIGIFSVKTPTSEKITQATKETIIRTLYTETLVRLQDRGRDATGSFLHFDSKEWLTLKQPVAAEDFAQNFGDYKYPGQEEKANYHSFIKTWKKISSEKSATKSVIGHVRKKTKGSEYDTNNNHPIKIGNIVGVHNGGITNDDKIFEVHKDFKRIGKVDSEAVFQLLSFLSNDAPPSLETVEEMDKRLRGTYSIFGTNVNYPGIVCSIRRSKPLDYCLIERLGLIIAVSEKKFVTEAILSYNRMVLSVSGLKTLVINAKDVEWIFLKDDTAILFNVSNEVESLKECVTTSNLGNHYTLRDEKYTITYNTSGVYPNNNWQNTKTPAVVDVVPVKSNTADLIDLSVYLSAETNSNVKLLDIGNKADATPAEEDTTTNFVQKKFVDVLDDREECTTFEEAREEATANMSSCSEDYELFIDDISEGNIESKFGLIEGQNDQEVLLGVVTDSYEEGFKDGWGCNTIEKGAVSDDLGRSGLIEKIKKMSSSRRKTSAYIANLKSSIYTMLILGGWVEMGESGGGKQIIIDNTLLDATKSMCSSFDEQSFFSLFSSEADIDFMDYSIKQTEPMDDEDDDEDENDLDEEVGFKMLEAGYEKA